jgi:hypothetical protein
MSVVNKATRRSSSISSSSSSCQPTTPHINDNDQHGSPSSTVQFSQLIDSNNFVFCTIDIERRHGQTLGFYITQEAYVDPVANTHNKGIFICKITDECQSKIRRAINLFDEIVRINDSCVTDMCMETVVFMLASHTSTHMVIKRRIVASSDNNKLPPIKQKNYDIVNGKVDQTYSHKLFHVSYNDDKVAHGADSSDDDDDDIDNARTTRKKLQSKNQTMRHRVKFKLNESTQAKHGNSTDGMQICILLFV